MEELEPTLNIVHIDEEEKEHEFPLAIKEPKSQAMCRKLDFQDPTTTSEVEDDREPYSETEVTHLFSKYANSGTKRTKYSDTDQ